MGEEKGWCVFFFFFLSRILLEFLVVFDTRLMLIVYCLVHARYFLELDIIIAGIWNFRKLLDSLVFLDTRYSVYFCTFVFNTRYFDVQYTRYIL